MKGATAQITVTLTVSIDGTDEMPDVPEFLDALAVDVSRIGYPTAILASDALTDWIV